MALIKTQKRGSLIIPPTGTIIPVAYNDVSLQYLGRWQDTGVGRWSGWGGSQVVFKVKGTSKLVVYFDVIDPDASISYSWLYAWIDGSNSTPLLYTPTSTAQLWSGSTYIVIPLPDIGEHTIILHTDGKYTTLFNATLKLTITGYAVDYGGSVANWVQGTKILQCVGDSWMSNMDWTHLMSQTRWKKYNVATGRRTCASMNSNYNFAYGSINASDPTADVVIVSFGVNDFGDGITNASFETSCYALIDKIRAKQANAKIVLIRANKNLNTGNDYGKYGVNMANVAANRNNVYYYDTTALDATVQPYWTADTLHITGVGAQALANEVDAYLTGIGV